jgi:Tol biopolymer transport system component
VAFSWKPEGASKADLYVETIESRRRIRLTATPEDESNPAWSPDGRQIAFSRESDTLGPSVYVTASAGGTERQVHTFRSATASRLDWSPDGRWLALSDAQSPRDPTGIVLLSIDTLAQRRLTVAPPGSQGDTQPAFSPDGRTAAFVRSFKDGVDIHLVDVSNGMSHPLTADHPARVSGLAWTADGTRLLFASAQIVGPSRLWTIARTGGDRIPVVGVGVNVAGPAITRNGSRLAFQQRLDNTNIYRFAPAHRGTDPIPRPLAISSGVDESPDVSRDAQIVVFVSDRSGTSEIWETDSEGKHSLQLTSSSGPTAKAMPRLSPDGRNVAFCDVNPRQASRDIYLFDRHQRETRRLTSDAFDDVAPSWSHDGQWIYFGSNRSGIYQIWKVPAAGGRPVQVTSNRGFAALESPDGHLLYYTKPIASEIWSASVEGGDEHLLVQTSRDIDWRDWAVSARGVFFLNPHAPQDPAIEFSDFGAHASRPVAVMPAIAVGGGLAVGPDARSIVFSRVDGRRFNIMIANGLR